jgi:hypothetical protein
MAGNSALRNRRTDLEFEERPRFHRIDRGNVAKADEPNLNSVGSATVISTPRP